MKCKYRKPILFATAAIASIAICLAVYYFVDVVMNGSFREWFEKNYMIRGNRYLPEEERYVFGIQPFYSKIKVLLLQLLIGNVLIWLMIVFGVSHFHAKSAVKKSITRTSRMMREFMDSKETAANLFPNAYSEIYTQMVEIKETMQHHEQILKDEANRKNDLIAYLAHDLKTPLTSVIGYLSLLDEATDMPAEQKAKYVYITLDKAKRLEKLINEFFDITRYNLQQIELEKDSIDLCYMLVQMADEFYPVLQLHGNTVDLDVDDNLVLYGDAEKLARVFNNILKNAVAYSYPDSPIRIWTESTAAEMKIYFQNKGKTIPVRKLDLIFEKFFRLDEARTTDTGGAGLGLAIAKEIVSLHAGTITASSQDEITTFCVTLPLGQS